MTDKLPMFDYHAMNSLPGYGTMSIAWRSAIEELEKHARGLEILVHSQRAEIARLRGRKDDAVEVDAEWFRSLGGTLMRTKREAYQFGAIVFAPQCGDLPTVLNYWENRVRENPTRGDVRRLAELFGIKLGEGA